MPIFPTGYTQKTTPADDDQVLIGDSAASNAIKKTKISAIVAKAVAAVQALTNWITTAMLQNNSVTTAKIDYTSLKTFIPDYANQSATNQWASSSTYTSTIRGFVYVYTYTYITDGTNNITSISINGKQVALQTVEAAAANGAKVGTMAFVLPVAVGDIVAFTTNGIINARSLYTVPGRWV